LFILLTTSYKVLSNSHLSRLSPYVDQIIEDHKCNRSTADQILHSSDTGEKVGIQWDSTSAIHRFQHRLLFSQEGSIVQYSDRVWGTHGTS
jgi:hypothetical protein